MLLYLDHAWEKFRAEGRMNNFQDLHHAVIEVRSSGSGQRS